MPPSFDQTAVDRRFLEEVYRLQAAGAFATFPELASTLQTHRGVIAAIESGRYHCTLKLLYLLQATYPVDALYILTGYHDPGRPPVVARPTTSSRRSAQQKAC